MTTPQNITLQVKVNGGGIQTGAITVAHSDTIDLSVDNTAGINKYRWEIFEYPEGLTLADLGSPAGWAFDGNSIVSTDPSPSQLIVPASTLLWGKFFLRLIVNDSLRGGKFAADLTDDRTALRIDSTLLGLEDTGFRETNQFRSFRQWMGAIKANWRALDGIATGGFAAPANPADDGKVVIASAGDFTYLAGGASGHVLTWNGTAWVSATLGSLSLTLAQVLADGRVTDAAGSGIEFAAGDPANFLGEVSIQRQAANVLTTTAANTVLNAATSTILQAASVTQLSAIVDAVRFHESGNPRTEWQASIAVFGVPGFVGTTGAGAGAGSAVGFIGGTGGPTDGAGGPVSVVGGGGGGANGPGGLLTLGGGIPTGAGAVGLINMAIAGATVGQWSAAGLNLQATSLTTTGHLEIGATPRSGVGTFLRTFHGATAFGRNNADSADRGIWEWGVAGTDILRVGDQSNAETRITSGVKVDINLVGSLEYSFGTAALDLLTNNLITTGVVSAGATPAASGTWRTTNNGSLRFRNAGDDDDIVGIQVTGTDLVIVGDTAAADMEFRVAASGVYTWDINDIPQLVLSAGTIDGQAGDFVTSTGSFIAGSDPSTDTAAVFRADNNVTLVSVRNAGDTANFSVLATDASDGIIIGGTNSGDITILRGANVVLDTDATNTFLRAHTDANDHLRISDGALRFVINSIVEMQVNATRVTIGPTELRFDSGTSNPIFFQQDASGAGATGDIFTGHAQNTTGTSGVKVAGALLWHAGDATGAGTSNTGGKHTQRGGNASGATANIGGDYAMLWGVGTQTTANITIGTDNTAWQSMQGGLFVGNRIAVPTGNPTAGAYLWMGTGALNLRSQDGWIEELSPLAQGAPLVGASRQRRVAEDNLTGGAGATTLITFAVPDETTVTVYATGNAFDPTGNNSAGYKRAATVKRHGGGGATLVGSVTPVHTAEDAGASAWDFTITVSGNNILIQATPDGTNATDFEAVAVFDIYTP